jgi:hypothetical protein
VVTIYYIPAALAHGMTYFSTPSGDANPCSRMAPCKTFAGTISKTAAKNEINVPALGVRVKVRRQITKKGGLIDRPSVFIFAK